jgi:hypothetical protein
MSWRSIRWQRTCQIVARRAGDDHAPGRPTRWETVIASFFDDTCGRDWLQARGCWDAQLEHRFHTWLHSTNSSP